jgi:hypothetical protein
MLKTAAAFLVTLCIAIGGGAASLSYVLDDTLGTGALRLGAWTAFPKLGTPDADPYARAKISREGVLALGSAEGLAFIAERDSAGRRLRVECNYRIVGATPPARFWTLFIQSERSAVATSPAGWPAALQSQALLRRADNSFEIRVGSKPAPQNWIGAEGRGPMRLVLTIYDSSITSGAIISETSMPEIIVAGCNA